MRQSLSKLLNHDAFGGILLMLAAVIAMILANSGADVAYFGFVRAATFTVNDGLMAVFFLLVGLEIKREFLSGTLSSKGAALQPIMAAVGGMMVPALIFLFVTFEYPEFRRGWAVPTATDIAFALGILTLVGKHVPIQIKILLTAIAVMDDLGAIVIIALFYTESLYPLYALLAAFGVFALFILNKKNNQNVTPYLICGAVVWWAFLKTGIHPTLAGVVTAFFIPITRVPDLEKKLHPFVIFFVLPVFAFVNAGLSLSGIAFANLFDPLALGVILGFLVGKPVGILVGLAVAGVDRVHEYAGMAFLCGVGFTMALFIGDLAFVDPAFRSDIKLGVLSASLLSAVIGWVLCRFSFRHKR